MANRIPKGVRVKRGKLTPEEIERFLAQLKQSLADGTAENPATTRRFISHIERKRSK
jgi:hypothetical protein